MGWQESYFSKIRMNTTVKSTIILNKQAVSYQHARSPSFFALSMLELKENLSHGNFVLKWNTFVQSWTPLQTNNLQKFVKVYRWGSIQTYLLVLCKDFRILKQYTTPTNKAIVVLYQLTHTMKFLIISKLKLNMFSQQHLTLLNNVLSLL